MKAKVLSAVASAVLRTLVTSRYPEDSLLTPLKKGGEEIEGISAETIAQIIDEDEYEVEKVLENWREFLQMKTINGETRYNLYHSSFGNWLAKSLFAYQ